jgi:hypothetical protein
MCWSRPSGADTNVALARSDAAACIVIGRIAEPTRGDLGEHDGLGQVFAEARCEAPAKLASLGFGRAQAIMVAARRAGVGCVIFISMMAVTTRLPARTKQIRLAAEQLIRHSEMDRTILRPTVIHGAPWDRNLPRLVALLRRLPIPGGGRYLQQTVHIADLAEDKAFAIDDPVRDLGYVPSPFAHGILTEARTLGLLR